MPSPLRLGRAFLFLSCFGWMLSAAAAQTAQSLASVDSAAQRIFNETGSTAEVLVVVRDREVYFQSFGETYPGSGMRPDRASLLRLCSLSKIFATDLLIKLALDDKLRLDTPLRTLMPASVEIPHVSDGSAREITLGDLATHTAGLPREIGPAPRGAAHFTYPSQPQRFAWLANARLKSTPGTAALYSNIGFDLLGDAIEAAAHKPYAQVLAERTTRPLQMNDTTLSPSPAQCARLMIGAKPKGACTDTENSAGSAGVYSTASDMARWLAYLLHVPGLAIEQNSAAQAVYVLPGQLRSVKGLDHAGDPSGIGLGWVMLNEPGDAARIVEKTGGGAGFTSYIALNPPNHTAVFLALTESPGPWRVNPFIAANNLLLALSNLPPMAEPDAMVHHAAPVHMHTAKHARKRRR